jgi:hypothetical protein
MDFRLQAEQAAEFLGLTLEPAHIPGVVANLVLLHTHAARIMTLDLPIETEAAPVYRP